MSTISFRHAAIKFFTVFMIACLLLSSLGIQGGLGTVSAQGDLPETPTATPTAGETSEPPIETPAATEAPTFSPSETSAATVTATTVPSEILTFTPEVDLTVPVSELSALDVSMAGSGSFFRARVQLKQPRDLERLKEWGITVLKSGSDAAFVQVDEAQLAKLARLGFQPTQIESLDYLALAYNTLNMADNVTSNELAESSALLMELSSVDTDSDGLTDTEEAYWCTDPNDNNSDSPNPPSQTNPSDGSEVQAILQGKTAYGPPFALWPQFAPHNPNGTCPDGDYDGVPDYAEEFMLGTSNLRESSDKDKFDDGQELFGVTFCPASSGPCGYGILPRAEDAAFVTANLPSWVLPPGNSPFVAAFPEPEVEVVPSSIKLTQVTVITNTNGTTVGTEKTYGTASTKGTSTSLANTITWNNWVEVSVTQPLSSQDIFPQFNSSKAVSAQSNLFGWKLAGGTLAVLGAIGGAACVATAGVGCAVLGLAGVAGAAIALGVDLVEEMDQAQSQSMINKCAPQCIQQPVKQQSNEVAVNMHGQTVRTQDRAVGSSTTYYTANANQQVSVQQVSPLAYPQVSLPTQTQTSGSSQGGAQTTTTTEYQEQTISESSTNQYSDNWSSATAVDSSHAADLRFTYNVTNNGTEYAREVTSLTFNLYIGTDSNPAYTYVAVGSTGQIAIVENLFPGDELTYTSNPIALTLDEMRAVDEGAPVRVVMEDISFGQDQVFYQDAMNGSVLVAIEDGYDDFDEVVDSYLIPVWDPSDSVQDVVKRYFPVTEDENGNLLSVYTPELAENVPTRCEQDTNIAPASNTNVFCKHGLTGTSWWNVYLSDGLDYSGEFKTTLAHPNTTALVRIVSDRDLDGYNDRNEIRLGTDPDDSASHPSPVLVAGYTKVCTGNDCTLRMSFQNLGNYDAYGVEAILYSPDGLVDITNNTIGGSGRVTAGGKVVVSENDTFKYTITNAGYAEPVIVVSYNDPQGNHRFILPGTALLTDLNADLTSLNGQMLPDPGVDISSTSADQANFVIFSPHPADIADGKLFVEYIDGQGAVLHEDVFTQDFASGPTVVPVTVDTTTYPPEETILLAFFTDSQGNIIDSSARPLASFGPDPLPVANLTNSDWEVGQQLDALSVDDPWDFGTVEPGTTLYAHLTLGNTGLGTLRYTLSGSGSGLTVTGIPAGDLGPSETREFTITLDTAGMAPGSFNRTLTMRTSDPNNASIPINITGTISTPTGTASAYQVSPFKPWDQYIYVTGPHNQNDIVQFTHTLTDDPARMFPLYLYSEDGQTLKGVGEYGVDFSGQTAPFGVFGTGADGDLVVSSGQTIFTDNTRSSVTATAATGQPTITISSASGFAPGQEVLIVQMKGTNTGKYEFNTIASITSNNLSLSKNLANTYTIDGTSKAQVIRVYQYHDVQVLSGGVLRAHDWDGSTGGVLAFRASGLLSVTGAIMMNGGSGYVTTGDQSGAGLGGGYRGGNNSADGSGAWAGEGYIGNYNSETQINQGNGGGGGGGYDYGLNDGAGGGNGSAGGNGENSNTKGGISVGTPALPMLFLGGGGGGGRCDTGGQGGAGGGGSGGGTIVFYARTIQVPGTISANGGNGASGCASGGGGAGGSILISGASVDLGPNRVTATGGNGPDQAGDGGVGRIRVNFSTLAGDTNPVSYKQTVNYYNITGQSAPFGIFGNGSDGDLTVASGQTAYTDNVRSALASTASAGQPNIIVANANGFTVGQEVLIIQVQGTSAGNYEFAAVTSINGNTITLSRSINNTFTVGGNSKAQIIRVNQYQNVTVQSGGILTVHAWDGTSGGVFAIRVSNKFDIQAGGYANLDAVGYRGAPTNNNGYTGVQGESTAGAGVQSTSANANGGGGGYSSGFGNEGGGGGGGNGTPGTKGQDGQYTGGSGGSTTTTPGDLSIIVPGGGGGSGGDKADNTNPGAIGGGGGIGGGVGLLFGKQITITGTLSANGNNGQAANPTWGDHGGGGGGAGGSVRLVGIDVSFAGGTVRALGGAGGYSTSSNSGGPGGVGRIRIEYTTLAGTTSPTASTSQVNFYNLTGSATNQLYLPDAIAAGQHLRYQLLYGQRSFSTDSGDQLFSVRLPNRVYSSITLNALMERVAGSGSTFNFCLDLANDAVCDWTASNQPFTEPVRLDSPNLASVLNEYLQSPGSTQETLVIPIRVNISTPADIFLLNVSGLPGQDADLQPSTPTIAPQNGAQPDNIGEGTLVDVSAAITNNGSHIAEDFTVGFYQGDPANGGTLIGSTFIESLAGGATSPVQSVVWNTSGLTPGSYAIYVKADVSNSITESSETNNIASAPAVVKKKPDLVLSSLTAPSLRQDEPGMAAITIKNEGEANVTGALVELYLGTDTTGTLLGSTTVDVPQGETVSGEISFSIPNAGLHDLFVKADPDNTVLEASETNNTGSGSAQIGWSFLTVDAAGSNDSAYSSSSGYGWLTQGTVITSCGTEVEKSYRQAGSAESLEYQFDHLLPNRYYHLDLTLAPCSGTRIVNIFADGKQTFESGENPLQTAQIPSDPHTLSLLLNPADYADGSVVLSIRRASGLSGPLVNIIDLQEVRYCYRDSGPGEAPWTAESGCGYDSTGTSDGFDGWGATAAETIRFDEAGAVPYRFTELDPSRIYDLRLTFYEEDGIGRIERLLIDGNPSMSYALDASIQRTREVLPQTSYEDGQVDLVIERTGSGDAIVSEVTLEENTRARNNRYPVPDALTPPTPTPTSGPTTNPVVVLSSFGAAWSGSQINLQWATTTEIDNSAFKLYRSPDALAWTEIASVASMRPCGNYTGTSPVTYAYTDHDVTPGQTYYYRLGFSGENCGMGFVAMASMLMVEPQAACYALTTSVTPLESGVVNVTAQNCEGGYTEGTLVQLTAVPNSGYLFSHWSGDAGGTISPVSVTMDGDKTVTANFDSTAIRPWPMYGHDSAHTGYSSFNGPNSADLLWSYPLGERAQDNASPVMGPDGTVYMPSEDGLFAINPNGTLKWSRWRNEITLTRNAPAIASDGTIYVTRWPGDELFALDPADGTTIWSYPIGGASYGSPTIGADGTVYIGNTESPSSFYAINPDGTLKWRWDSGSPCWVESSAAIGPNGDIYFQHNCLGLVSLNSSGELNWTYPGAGDVSNSPSVGPDGTIYLADSDGYFYAFNPDGTFKWRAPVENLMYESAGAIASDGQTIYQGDNGGIFYAFDSAGSVKWQYDTGLAGTITSAPALTANGIVYFTHGGGNLYALRATNGSLLWQYAIGSSSSSPAIGADGSLYVTGKDASNNAVLYAFACANGLCELPDEFHTLTISKTGTGTGSVTSSPAGIDCGSDCSESYAHNTDVTLTAISDAGSAFSGWSGDVTGTDSPVLVTMDGDKTITANFTITATTPTLISPDGTFSDWDNLFHWSGIGGVDYYRLEVTDNNDVLVYDQWYTTSICTGLDCAVSPAPTQSLANGDYKWRVQTYGLTGLGPWTPYMNFTLNLEEATLVAPSGILTTWDNLFTWTGISTADFYQLEVYDTGDVLVHSQWFTSSTCTDLNCGASPAETLNLANGDYRWHVRTYGASGFGPYTEFMSFTLDVAEVTLISPSGTLSSWDNLFHWTGISSADFYRLEVYDASDTLLYGQWYTTSICTDLDCAASPAETANLANADYKWRVQTYGATGFSPYTKFMNFSLRVILLDAPSGTHSSWNNRFSWTGLADADFYRLEVTDGNDVLLYDQWYTTSICTGLDCAVSPAETMDLGDGDYKWRVQTYGLTGLGPWSPYLTFSLNLEEVILLSPSGPLTTWENLFRWTGISTADFYQLEVYDASDISIYSQWFTTSICTGLDCAVSPAETQNLANGDYHWRVRTYGSSGFTAWTAFTNLTLDVQGITLIAPTGTLTAWDNTFSWTGISGADFYQLEVYDASDTLVHSQWFTSSICTDLDCAVSPTETLPLANGDYHWRVRTYGASGFTAWTAFMNFSLNR